ncbi:P-loop containing nucleoside triphosphate hydrolase protein [Globomyces pollinis-pini]|nr:P-loop containing nucleoside triphosphate hydrolase protein [Globomyces pollinis-pini]
MVKKQVKITPFNFLTIEWITPLLFKGAKAPLTEDDLYELPGKSQATYLSGLLDPFWAQFYQYQKSPKTSKSPSLFATIGVKYAFIFFMALALQSGSVACGLTQPTYLKQIILYLNPLYPKNLLYFESGVTLSIILTALQIGGSIFEKVSQQLTAIIQVDLKTILIGAVYEKSLRLSQASSRTFTQGKILNLINVDIEKISMMFVQIIGLIMAPVQVVVSIILLGDGIGYAVWGGAGALFGILFMQLAVIGFLVKFQKEFLATGDRRLKSIREVLYGMKIIKFRALEKFFSDRINAIRFEQITTLKKYYAIQVYFIGLIQIAPIAMPIIAFLVYGAGGKTLTPEVIFPALSLFGGLFAPILVIPQSITAVVLAIVSWNRLTEFLLAEEADELESKARGTVTDESFALTVKDGSFKWEVVENDEDANPSNDKQEKPKKKWGKSKKPTEETKPTEPEQPIIKDSFSLNDVNIQFPVGSKVAIVGPVGSGKSSLLSGIIGEMPKISGSIEINGSVAYCSQQPWILTDSIRGNIVFNQELDESKLESIIVACGLDKDLELFPSGVMTEIGEKGVNMSGGQKARIAVARAMYRSPEVILLDDPLSALDAHVGQLLFNEAILKYLKEKTVIVVTHQLHFLPEFDHIVVMNNGTIAEQGTYKGLMEQDGVLTELMKNYSVDEKSTEKKDNTAVVVKEEKDISNKAGIIVEEDILKGTVGWNVYWHYFDKCGGWFYVTTFVTAGLLNSGTQVVNNLWLSWWTDNKFNLSLETNMLVYGLLGVLQFFFALIINTVFLAGSFKAAKYYHGKALAGLMRSPMGFFDSQPIGRILNRMSKDIESVDQSIWILMFLVTISTSGIIATTIFLIYTKWTMVFLLLPLLVVFYIMIRYYQRSNISFKRFESTHRSPLYSHVSETLAGISTVKAYGVEKEFIQKQRQLMDFSNVPTFLRLLASVWISLRLEILTSTITFLLCITSTSDKDNASATGVALTYAINFTRTLALLLLSTSQLENEFNSIERLSVYCDQLPKEAAEFNEKDPNSESWPSNGEIQMENVSMSYPSRPDVLVLKNLSFSVKAGEKIGVIGRTGSGKSTLMQALFRIVELQEGKIQIDGLDIRQMGLNTLRNGIQIIPQEPVLFSGTIRDNLDVESFYTDNDIWDVLERIGLKDYVQSLADKLDSPVTENGENLSVGQRQLICLGRAILVKPKILVMDEATASVDADADKLIQESIKTHFAQTTVLSIAHRLNTIIDFDRVLVLEKGELIEYDHPHTLLSKPDGLFSMLADATGPTNSGLLREIAKTTFNSN